MLRLGTNLTRVLAVSAGLLSAGAGFDVRTIPIEHPDAGLVMADADRDGIADFLVLSGSRVVIHGSRWNGAVIEVQLEKGVSAFDVADLDGDGLGELIAVAGGRILRYVLEQPGKTPTAEVLFSLDTHLSNTSGAPFAHVLTAVHEGQTVLALPRGQGLEYRSIEGELIAVFPVHDPGPGLFGPHFSAWNVHPARTGPPNALEYQVDRLRTAALPPSFYPQTSQSPRRGQRRATRQQLRDVANRTPESWPWFALRTAGDSTDRVLYALVQPALTDTVLRIRRRPENRRPLHSESFQIGPRRVYPGRPVPPGDRLPDFNGDGYTDLVLWRTPLPGASVGSFIRVAQRGTWPITLMIHLYDPARGRYAGNAKGRLQCELPVSWYIVQERATPLRNLLFRDFDRDGQTDIAFTSAPNEFALWIYRDGFAEKPDYTDVFPEAITRIEQVVDRAQNGTLTVVLRGERALYAVSLPEE